MQDLECQEKKSANFLRVVSLKFKLLLYCSLSISTMSKDFSADISSRICKHMNDDHADAIVLYAKAFGGVTDA